MYALQGPEKMMLRAAPSRPEPHLSLLDFSIFSIRSDPIRSIIRLRSNRIEEAGDRIVSIRSRGESRSNRIVRSDLPKKYDRIGRFDSILDLDRIGSNR